MSGRAGRARQADAGTGSGARRWDARGAGARGSRRQAGARGAWARARHASGSRRERARSAWGWAGWAAGARPGRWARGLGAWAGLGQCTRCTRPIVDPF